MEVTAFPAYFISMSVCLRPIQTAEASNSEFEKNFFETRLMITHEKLDNSEDVSNIVTSLPIETAEGSIPLTSTNSRSHDKLQMYGIMMTVYGLP